MFRLNYHPDRNIAVYHGLNPIALRKAKIVYNFGLSEYNRVKTKTVHQLFHSSVCWSTVMFILHSSPFL